MPIIYDNPQAPVDAGTPVEGGMTLREMREHAFFLADEQPNVLFTEDDVDRLINMGIQAVFRETGFPFADASYTVSPGVQTVALTDAVLDTSMRPTVTRVILRSQDGTLTELLEGVEPVTRTRAMPTAYFLRGENLTLVEDPDAAYTLEVRYRHAPGRYAADDHPPLAHDHIEVACIYAVGQMKLKDDQLGTSDRWRDEFHTRLRESNQTATGVYEYTGG